MFPLPKQTFPASPTNVCLDPFVFAEFFAKPGRPLLRTLPSTTLAEM